VERVLPAETMVIDLNGELGAIAGVMGGLSSEIENDTTSTFLESANFDSVKVRKTATALGLRSEASARYEKSLDPEMTITALLRYVYLLKNIDSGIKVVSNITDVYVNKYDKIKLNVSKEYIDRYTGVDISKEQMIDILTSLGFGVKVNGEEFEIDVPTWRATKDISVKADIVEEITRVYGYDNIKATPIKQPITPKKLGIDFVRNYDIKYALADKYNMHEIHSNIWEDANENKRLGIETNSYIYLVNSLQKDNDDIRSTMLPTIIRALDQNKKYKNSFGLFEIGHVVTDIKDNLAVEEISLGMGNIFAKIALGIENPRVALMNIGAEEMKGKNEIHVAAHIIKNSNLNLNFTGYIEPHDIPKDKADVIVADGFSGNIALKSVEGTCNLVMKLIKKSIKESFFAKLGLPFMIGAIRKLKKTMDPRLYNGAMFVGLNGLSVKSHGGTDAFGFSIAVENAARLVRKDFVASIRKELENIDLEELSQEACYEVY
jgi:phenylalanyl-tRNA synthetase beta subunit